MTIIPFADLAGDWASLRDDVLIRIDTVMTHGQFVAGPEVTAFEGHLRRATQATEAVACSSGTVALQLALLALGVGPGDEVIVPAFTFPAPAEMVILLGAVPVVVDVDPKDYTIDPVAVSAAITTRTKAVIGVSLFGQPADFPRLRSAIGDRPIALIDDAAQSFGATLGDRITGTLADVTCLSFFPTKPLGGIGDGGAVLTSDAMLAAAVREVRDHGQSAKYVHARLGTNGRLDSIACAALVAMLGHVAPRLARRHQLASRYTEALAAVADRLVLPHARADSTPVFALYTVQVDEREAMVARLAKAGVATAVHYPRSLHQQPAFANRVRHESLPVTESLCRRVVSLPLYPTMTDAQQDHVVREVLVAVGHEP